MIVVSDTSPICHLLLIDKINTLQILYGSVTIPKTVADELSVVEAPLIVQNWIAQPPSWLCIKAIEAVMDIELE